MTKRSGIVVSLSIALLVLTGCLAEAAKAREPIIDVHLHAHTLSMYGTPPPAVCTSSEELAFLGADPKEPLTQERVQSCRAPLSAPATDEELLRGILERLERYNIWAVTTGSLENVTTWRRA